MAEAGAPSDNRARLGLLVIAILAILRFAVVPLYQWQNQMLEEVAVLERYQARGEKPEYGKALKERHQSYQSALNELEAQFPEAENINTLQFRAQQTLERLARADGVTIQRTDWGVAAPSKALLKAPMRVRVQGRLDNLHQWLQTLESPQQAFKVQALTIQPDSRARYNYIIDLNIEALALPGQPDGNAREGLQ